MSETDKNRLERIYKESVVKPPYTSWSLARRFFVFQYERVPLLILAIMGVSLTYAITKLSDAVDWNSVVIASSMIVLYFLQIRLADEPKDFEHDNKHYPQRPVQRGLITLRELAYLKNIVIVAFLILAVAVGSWAVLILAIIQQGYSFLTRKEFFLREWLRKHFLTYQFSHYVQLLILGWLVLSVLSIQPLFEKGLYFGYSMLMIGLVESSRTIGGVDKKAAKDRYSYRLGITTVLTSFVVFIISVVAYTAYLVERTGRTTVWLPIIFGIGIVTYSIVRYRASPTTKNAELLNGASLIVYVCSSLTIILS